MLDGLSEDSPIRGNWATLATTIAPKLVVYHCYYLVFSTSSQQWRSEVSYGDRNKCPEWQEVVYQLTRGFMSGTALCGSNAADLENFMLLVDS